MYIIKYIEDYKNKSSCGLSKIIRKNNEYKKDLFKYTDFLPTDSLINERIYVVRNNLNKRPVCLECKHSLNFKVTNYGTFCSRKCAAIYNQKNMSVESKEKKSKNIKKTYYKKTDTEKENIKENRKKTFLLKYKVDNNFKIPKIKEQRNNTFLKKYGYTSPAKNGKVKEKIKKTNIEKYGYTCPLQNKNVLIKSKKTLFENYGVDSPFKSHIIRKKARDNYFNKHGVYHHMQNAEIYYKSLKACFAYKEYIMPSGKIVKIQGYENIALDLLLEQFKEDDFLISNTKINKIVKPILYFYENKIHRYYPDFFIKSINTIIEVKSKYTYNNSKNVNEIKRIESLLLGYNFWYIIIDKNIKIHKYEKITN